MKNLLKAIQRWTGFERRNNYTNRYFLTANVKASVYMAIIVVILEGYMIEQLTELILPLWNKVDKFRDPWWLFTHYGRYGSLFLVGIAVLVYDFLYLKGKKVPHWLGYCLIWLFAAVCLWFGNYVGLDDYSKGEQILTFLTMQIFVLCLLVWRPFVSFILSSGTFYLFLTEANKLSEASRATRFNLTTFWISITVISISLYHARYNEASKEAGLEEANEHLRHISDYDELTGLHNLRYFKVHAFKGMAIDKNEVREYNDAKMTAPLTELDKVLKKDSMPECLLLYFDIENFKAFNETHTFADGDMLLQYLAKEFERVFTSERVARFSDDHFVALVRADELEEKLAAAQEAFSYFQDEVKLNLKIGSYRTSDPDIDVALACDYARIACNSIKNRMEEDYKEYDATLESKKENSQYVINHLEEAIEKDYIKPFYQPIMDAKTGKLIAMEALARWDDPERGLMPPYKFIETLEANHEIGLLDQKIMRTVCSDLGASAAAGDPLARIPVSLNFSRIDFDLYDVPAVLSQVAKANGVTTDLLHVEITESALTGSFDKLKSTMDQIHQMGYTQWLDDFGSGYSSLNVLKDFNFDVMKIDMVFLRGFETNPETKTVIEAIVKLAKQLNMKTLTEGVETKEQYEFLKSIGCDMVQGYYFGKPMPRQEVLDKISSGELAI